MPIKLGAGANANDDIGAVFVGTEEIGEIYVGTELVWQKIVAIMFEALATYTGGTFSASGGSIPVSDYTTNMASPSAGNVPSNLATDASTRRSNVGTNTGGVTTFTETGQSSLTPVAGNVFNTGSNTFTQTYTATGTESTTAVTRTDTYSFVAGSNTSFRNNTITVSGTIPTGQNFINEGDPTSDTMTVPQSADTATTSATAVCGTLSAGNSTCTQPVTVTAASGPTAATRTGQTQTVAAAGTLSFNVTDADPDNTIMENEAVSFTAGAVSSTYSPTPTFSYSWSNVGTAPGSFNSTTSQAVTFTATGTGTVIARCTVSHAGDASTTFTATDDSDTVTVTASGCSGTVTATQQFATVGNTGACQPLGLNGCSVLITSTTGSIQNGISVFTPGTTATNPLSTPFTQCSVGGAFGITSMWHPVSGGLTCSGTGASVPAAAATQPGTACPATGTFNIPS